MYQDVISVENSPLLKINNIGCSNDPSHNRFGPGMRNVYLIHYVIKGKGYYNGTKVCRGQGFLITKGQFEEYFPDENDPWEYLWVTSSDDNILKLFEHYNADSKTLVFNYPNILDVENAMHFIRKNNGLRLSAAQILEMFLHILNGHANSNKNDKSDSEIYVDFCKNYIKTNLHKQISIKEIVDALGISSAYLLKIFKLKTGLSPKQYMTALRINSARKLLTETNLTITQVANSLGFDDVLSFSRFFRKKEGISPKEYRSFISKNKI